MAPVFFRLEAEVDEVPGVPTELNERLLAGELDLAPISSIEYGRNAERLRILPRLCVSSEGAVDSIQLVSRQPLERVRTVAVTPESATSVVLVKVLLPDAEHVPARRGRRRAAPDRRRRAAQLPSRTRLRTTISAASGSSAPGCRWCSPSGPARTRRRRGSASSSEALVASVREARAEPERLAFEASERYGYPPGFLARYFEKLRYRFGPRERAGLMTFFELARDAGELDAVPELRFAASEPVSRVTTARRPRTRRSPASGSPTRTRSRCSEAATSSRVGRAADELRNRITDPGQVTFIIDRNVNYTNICHTDCDFCAFYRRPGDRAEGYLLPKPVIFKKIEETLAIGGTALLMQGGHHPDLGIDFYEDLFRSIKARYRIHLHALSPPEIQHIARRSKLTIPETLTRLRDAGLDSLPGGGAEILVDRVRDIIAPKKTKTGEWLGVMRDAHRLGISSTATMMYGHVETRRRARRAHAPDPRAPGRDARLPRLHLLDVPAGRTRLAARCTHYPTSFDYLLTQAVSRIYLDNVDHIQSSWVTQGMKVGQVALSFGADDMGSVMIEENVVSAAGTTHRATTDDFVAAIKAHGQDTGAAGHAVPPAQGLGPLPELGGAAASVRKP